MTLLLDNVGWVATILGGLVGAIQLVLWIRDAGPTRLKGFRFAFVGAAVVMALCGALWIARTSQTDVNHPSKVPDQTDAERRMKQFEKERFPNGLSPSSRGPSIALAAAVLGYAHDERAGPRVVAVLPFENLSNVRSKLVEQTVSTDSGVATAPKAVMVDSLSQSARLSVEEVLVQHVSSKFRVVERRRIDQILLEKDFGRILADETKAAAFAGAQGATTLVLGTIKSLDRSTREFDGYGIKLKRDVARIEINVRVIDVASLEVIVSKPFEASIAIDETANLHQSMPDVADRLLKQCASLMQQDQSFLRDVMTRNPAEVDSFVKVKVESSIEGADVLVDGEFIGNAPAEFDARVSRSILVEVERAGFGKWSRRLTPRSDMVFKASLERLPPPTAEDKESTKKEN